MIYNKKAYPDLRKDCETCSERYACFSGHSVGVGVMALPADSTPTVTIDAKTIPPKELLDSLLNFGALNVLRGR